MRRPSPERPRRLRTALLLAAAASLASCSMFGVGKKGTPDNEPTLKTPRRPRGRGRSPTGRSSVTEEQAIDAYRKFLDDRAEGAAALRGDAPARRPRDGPRRQQAAPAAAEAPDYKAAIARYNDFLQGLPERPGQRPRALPARARLRAGRRPEHGAEDARPAGQGLPAQPLPRRGAVPPRRAAVHRQGLSERREGLRHRARRRPDRAVPRPLALHAGLVAVQAGAARGRRCARSSPCST